MTDSFRTVHSGDYVAPARSTYNLMVQAAQAHAMLAAGPGGLPNNAANLGAGQTIVQVKNSSGSTVRRFGVLGVDDFLVAPGDNLAEFQRIPMLVGTTPAAGTHEGMFVVCLEPIANGKIGKAVAMGLVQVQLNVNDANDTHAEIKDTDLTQLDTGTSGSAVIIQKQSGTGTKWGLVRLGPVVAPPWIFTAEATITASDATWAVPAGTKYLLIVAKGGDGGGGGGGGGYSGVITTSADSNGDTTDIYAGGGGGGQGGVGAVAIGYFLIDDSITSLNVVIGAAGASASGGAAGNTGNTGGTGGTTSVSNGSDVSVSADGGMGGDGGHVGGTLAQADGGVGGGTDVSVVALSKMHGGAMLSHGFHIPGPCGNIGTPGKTGSIGEGARLKGMGGSSRGPGIGVSRQGGNGGTPSASGTGGSAGVRGEVVIFAG